jgi:hypothetical protein
MQPVSSFRPNSSTGRRFCRDKPTTSTSSRRWAWRFYATQATRVTDEMFIEAARAVADQVPSELMSQGLLYPLQANVLEAEIRTAARVAKLVFDSGLARVKRPTDMLASIRAHVLQAGILSGPSDRSREGRYGQSRETG